MIKFDYTGEPMAMTARGMEDLRAFSDKDIDVVAAAAQFKEWRNTRMEVNAKLGSTEDKEYGFTGSSQAYRVGSDGETLVIPIEGMIEKKPSIGMMFMGGTSTEMLASQVDRAKADDSVKRVMLKVDSPGGSVKGIQQASGRIAALAAEKTVHAFAEGNMASAAYWLSSPADKIHAAPSSMVGSIGTMSILQNIKEAEDEAGIETKVVRSLPMKGKPNPHEKLDDASIAQVEKIVQVHHDHFVGAVTKHRSTLTTEKIENMEGKVFISAEAVDAELADDEMTLEAALTALAQIEDAGERAETAKAMAEGARIEVEGAADEATVARLEATVEALQDGMSQQSANAETARIEAMVKEAAGSKIPAAKAEKYVQKGKEYGAEWLEETLAMIPEGATVPQGDGTKIGGAAKGGGDRGETPDVDAEQQSIMDQIGVSELTESNR